MSAWHEVALDVLAVLLIAVGLGLWRIEAGFVAAGVGVAALSIGLRARRQPKPGRRHKAIEVVDE